MKKILIVDDDKVLLTLFVHVLRSKTRSYEIITASNGKEAIEIIKNTKIDLVITDLYMPVINGFEVVAYITSYYPDIPVYAMTAKSTPEVQAKVEVLGSLKFIQKPVNIDKLTESIIEELQVGPRSQLYGITLPSFMQLLEMEQKTCTLIVQSGHYKGKMYFINGMLSSAETHDLKNEPAVFEMIGWDNVKMELEYINREKGKEINQPMKRVIMEGVQRKHLLHETT